MFDESSKSRGVYRTQASIYDGAFLWICNSLVNEFLTATYFCNKSSITDIGLGYM